MKKILFAITILIFLFSCKKETKTEETVATSNDSTVMVKDAANQVSENFTLKEITAAQTSEFLGAKNTDTVYVTNFFATWCGPCMIEIPHFKEKMTELKDKPVKFTFVSFDEKSDWETEVKEFAAKNNLQKNIILVDGKTLNQDFYTKILKLGGEKASLLL